MEGFRNNQPRFHPPNIRPPFHPVGGYRPPGRGGYRHNYHGRPHTPFSNQNPSAGFWCETCDRSFRTPILLENHVKEHMKCSIDGCQFVAHPKVITKHIEMQHSTGLYNRIGNLNNPEAIQKWREERKKRFPTKINIDRKKAELQDKVDRGEKMGLGNDWRRNNNSGHKFQKKDGFIKRNNSERQHRKRKSVNYTKEPSAKIKKNDSENAIINDRKLKPFAGILNLLYSEEEDNDEPTEKNDPIEEDEFELESSNCNGDSNEKVTVCGALSSLIMNYDSSDEENTGSVLNTTNKEPQSNNIIGQSKLNNPINPQKDDIEHFQSPLVVGDTNNLNQTAIPHSNQNTLVKNKEEIIFQVYNSPIEMKEKENNESLVSVPQGDLAENKSGVISEQAFDTSRSVGTDNSLEDINKKEESDDSAPDEVHSKKPNGDTIINNTNEPTSINRKNKILHHQRKNKFVRRSKLPSTLLEKLLINEIRHERNVILQCIKHIVTNNYFDNTTT